MNSVRRVLYVSRSCPPGVSGSAHVLKEFLRVDEEKLLSVVGSREILSFDKSSTEHIVRLKTEISFFGRGARFFSWVRILLLPAAARRIARLAESQNVSRILCVFPDSFYCTASLFAAIKTGKPLHYYFHNTYAANRTGLVRYLAKYIEARMLAKAEKIYFISDALQAYFISLYPNYSDKLHVLHHPVDVVDSASLAPRGFLGSTIKALLMGNLNESNVDAANRMIRALGGRSDLVIRVCTPVPRALLIARGMNVSKIDYLGYVPESEMQGLLEETDLFLLPHGLHGKYSKHEYDTIFPTRSAYYMCHARPILAHCPKDSGLNKFLEVHECALIVNEANEQKIVESFEKLKGTPELQRKLAVNAKLASARFSPRLIFNKIISRP